jgi:hypothetical protein
MDVEVGELTDKQKQRFEAIKVAIAEIRMRRRHVERLLTDIEAELVRIEVAALELQEELEYGTEAR